MSTETRKAPRLATALTVVLATGALAVGSTAASAQATSYADSGGLTSTSQGGGGGP